MPCPAYCGTREALSIAFNFDERIMFAVCWRCGQFSVSDANAPQWFLRGELRVTDIPRADHEPEGLLCQILSTLDS